MRPVRRSLSERSRAPSSRGFGGERDRGLVQGPADVFHTASGKEEDGAAGAGRADLLTVPELGGLVGEGGLLLIHGGRGLGRVFELPASHMGNSDPAAKDGGLFRVDGSMTGQADREGCVSRHASLLTSSPRAERARCGPRAASAPRQPSAGLPSMPYRAPRSAPETMCTA
jgi:hypothetical protein